MSINLRETKLTKNRVRISLEIYYRGKSRYENLGLFYYEKPSTKEEREHNKRTRDLAENIKSKRILEVQDNRYNVITGFKSQGSFLQYFKKLTEERRRSAGNYGNWYSTNKHLLGFANGRDIKFADCDEIFLNQFKKYLLQGRVTKGNQNLSSCSASSYLNKIKAALNQAFDDKIINDNPSKRVKGIKVPEGRREYLLAEDLRKLYNTGCMVPILKNAFLFSCLTGLRWSDINKLTWKEVIYSEAEKMHKIHYTQKKTKGVEYHPISEAAYKLLGNREDDDARVFKGLKYSAWYNLRLAQWVMDAGINKKITFHCARHTYATLLLTSGGDIYTVSSLLGHRDLKTTQIYAKIIDQKKNDIVELLPDIGI
jgi:integrase